MKKSHKGIGYYFKKAVKLLILAIYKATFGLYLCLAYNVHVTRNDMKAMKGPFILIGNHVSDFDGCFIQLHANHIISFVINNKAFRTPVLRVLLLFFDMIPKKKFTSDIQAVRRIFKAKERGDIIGVFPEGSRSWDGNTLPVIKSTATLVKSVRLPVVATHINGAATASPRWRSGKHGRGIVEIEYVKLLDAEQINRMSVDEINNALVEGIHHNEAQYTLAKKVAFKRRKRAEGLERFLFICPKCERMGTTVSHDDSISCACGMHARYTELGLLEGGSFQTLGQWDAWQRGKLSAYIKESSDDTDIFTDHDVDIYCAKGLDSFRFQEHGTVSIGKERIRFSGDSGRFFSTHAITGVNIQSNNIFEFNFEDRCYRLKFPGKTSAYKWEMLYDIHIGCCEI